MEMLIITLYILLFISIVFYLFFVIKLYYSLSKAQVIKFVLLKLNQTQVFKNNS
jgi:hypothetical protein